MRWGAEKTVEGWGESVTGVESRTRKGCHKWLWNETLSSKWEKKNELKKKAAGKKSWGRAVRKMGYHETSGLGVVWRTFSNILLMQGKWKMWGAELNTEQKGFQEKKGYNGMRERISRAEGEVKGKTEKHVMGEEKDNGWKDEREWSIFLSFLNPIKRGNSGAGWGAEEENK